MKYFKHTLIGVIIGLCQLPLLGQNGIYSNIEDALKNPKSVKELELTDLNKDIPKEIVNLTNLRKITFNKTPVDFNLKKSFKRLSKLHSLEEVYFTNGEQVFLPKSISKLKRLKYVDLSYKMKQNPIEAIETLSKLKNLEKLDLKSCKLTKIPDCITDFSNLQSINLDDNPNLDYELLFNQLSQLQLEHLDLSSGKFDTIPDGILKLKYLKRLELQMIEGKFNNEESFKILSKIPNLIELNIQGNFLGNLDESIKLLQNLKLLEIDGNCILDENFEKIKQLLPNTKIQNEIPC